MPRPSLKAEKTEIILTAYEQCVARYGVDGATLQKVAETANMARPLLRHYVGNQEDLLHECTHRYLERSRQSLSYLTQFDNVQALLDALFSVPDATHKHDIAIASALTLAATEYSFLHDAMQQWFAEYRQVFAQALAAHFPAVAADTIQTVAIGIIGIYFNYHAMLNMNDHTDFTVQSRQSAMLLIQTLSA